eukprot:CAMPEP_0177578076 /NCGR_PEP_ID=MMETSP0419_2-20121207/134_1 /TAXON_ID=582737 /ORGANISM="Tetraselmis sp., Strain GSL018" /LENGTH=297 /DNA_ID=CAMNT_0019066453 /DNA_START=149 /DNA_END=1042 /DNA_ORIENTATION=-
MASVAFYGRKYASCAVGPALGPPQRFVKSQVRPADKHCYRKFHTHSVNQRSEAEVLGMDTSEGIFGFTPFAERWVGRLAMTGIVSSVLVEAQTGEGTLKQIGLVTPSPYLLIVLFVVFGGAITIGSAITLRRASSGAMSLSQKQRYLKLLGLANEMDNIAQTEAELKGENDPVRFALSDQEAAIEEARAAGTAADEFFGDERLAADTEAQEMKKKQATSSVKGPSMSLEAREDVLEQTSFTSRSSEYAKQVEIRNGRAAMIGFLAAIMAEANSGHGIIQQVVDVFQYIGVEVTNATV